MTRGLKRQQLTTGILGPPFGSVDELIDWMGTFDEWPDPNEAGPVEEREPTVPMAPLDPPLQSWEIPF